MDTDFLLERVLGVLMPGTSEVSSTGIVFFRGRPGVFLIGDAAVWLSSMFCPRRFLTTEMSLSFKTSEES